MRKAIEDFAIPLVVEKITKQEIAGLKANITTGEHLIRDGKNIRTIIRSESEFHELLYRAAKSDILYDTVLGLVDRFQWFRALALSVPEAAGSSLSHHKEMVNLIEKKDVEGFKKMMRMHLDEAQGRIIALPGILL